MKIAVGHRETTTGYLETTPHGLVISSDTGNQNALEGIVNYLRHTHPNWSDEDIIKWYLHRSDGIYDWAFIVPNSNSNRKG